ncbi:MAG TPA: TonB-dependent receptor, partial [Aquabacterium sp.]|nr:TonB-dependent receptor [Aquabacterium sp.]
AWVRGSNRTDDLALAQLPPLEARLALDWEGGRWSAGGLLRLVSAQKHYALDQGNIVGQDVGPTGGFGVMSLHGGYRWREGVQLTAGIDNLFDKTYAESVSRAGAMVSGYEQTTRVNEPGRTLWVKWQFALE